MTRGWWGRLGWMGHEERVSGDLGRERGADGDECHAGSSRPAERLTAPQGVLVWLCVSPAGARTAHDHEWQARNQAAMHVGSVYYPATVELEETA